MMCLLGWENFKFNLFNNFDFDLPVFEKMKKNNGAYGENLKIL